MTVDAGLDFCYVTTTGRMTGRPHRIEIWFAADGGTLYLLAGGRERADWVRNLVADPHVRVEVGDRTFDANARVLEAGSEEDQRARDLVFTKYQPRYSGDLTSWRDSALPVALDVAVSAA